MFENKFFIYQKLKCIARVSLMGFVSTHECDPLSSIFLAYYNKTIDICDGIIQLYKNNLPECAQILFRVLFETYLKHEELLYLLRTEGPDETLELVRDSIVIMREKDAESQENVQGMGSLVEHLPDLEYIKGKYKETEVKEIRKNGFPRLNVEKLAKKFKKISEYQIMYRNFSRNVHANDLVEYMLKQGHVSDPNYIERRDKVAIDQAFRITLDMIIRMNYMFEMSLESEIKKIKEEYNNITD